MANFKNLASSFVVTAPSTPTAGTSLTVTSGTGSYFPAAPFYATLTPPASLSNYATAEVVLVTAVSTDTFTITRAQKTTTAQTVATGWIISNGIYAEDITGSISYGLTPSGLVNSSNKVYTLPAFTSVEVFKNGVRMAGGGADYTVTNNTTITFVTAPTTGAVLVANTIIGSQVFTNGSSSFQTDEVPSGLVNGSNTTYTTLSVSYGPGTLEVFVNGVKQKRGVHFTETNPSTGSFTMSDAPLTGDDIMVNYQFQISVSGNADTVDGYHATATPSANALAVLDSNGQFPISSLSGTAQAWTPTLTGFSANPTGVYRYFLEGKLCTLFINQITNGTSNSSNFTISLPFTAATVANAVWSAIGQAVDNGVSSAGLMTINSGATVLVLTKDTGGSPFTASGNKRTLGLQIMYEIA